MVIKEAGEKYDFSPAILHYYERKGIKNVKKE